MVRAEGEVLRRIIAEGECYRIDGPEACVGLMPYPHPEVRFGESAEVIGILIEIEVVSRRAEHILMGKLDGSLGVHPEAGILVRQVLHGKGEVACKAVRQACPDIPFKREVPPVVVDALIGPDIEGNRGVCLIVRIVALDPAGSQRCAIVYLTRLQERCGVLDVHHELADRAAVKRLYPYEDPVRS